MKETMTMVAYEAPMVEVIEVEVEKGFAASNVDLDTHDLEWCENKESNGEEIIIFLVGANWSRHVE